MDVTYTPNQAGWREIAHSVELREVLTQIGEDAKAYAEGLAQESRKTGEYASSFQLEETTVVLGGRSRAALELQNTSDHAAAVEWGYHGRSGEPSTSAHHVLARTLDYLEHR